VYPIYSEYTFFEVNSIPCIAWRHTQQTKLLDSSLIVTLTNKRAVKFTPPAAVGGFHGYGNK
jgi:hypothetical protein